MVKNLFKVKIKAMSMEAGLVSLQREELAEVGVGH